MGFDQKFLQKKNGNSQIFNVFLMKFWSKAIPIRSDNPADHFEPVSASPDHSQPILQQVTPARDPKQGSKAVATAASAAAAAEAAGKKIGNSCFSIVFPMNPWPKPV